MVTTAATSDAAFVEARHGGAQQVNGLITVTPRKVAVTRHFGAVGRCLNEAVK